MPTDTRTPQQQWDDLFRPPATLLRDLTEAQAALQRLEDRLSRT